MKKVFDFSTQSEFDQSFEQLQNNVDFQRLNDKFTVKPFYLKYKGLKVFLNGFSYFIQVVTVSVSFVCVVALLSPMMNIYFAYAVATGALVGIEFLKRLTFRPTVKEFLQFKKVAVFNLCLSLSMLAVSLWLTWNGGKETVFLLSDAPTLVNIDSSTQYEKTRINELTAQLNDIKRTQSWKGVLTPKGQTSYNRVTGQIEKLQNKIDGKENDLTNKNDLTTNDHKNKTTATATQFRFVTVVLDILLFVLLAWLEFYDYRSFTEFAKLRNDTDKESNDKRINDNRNNDVRQNDTPQNIPFSMNENRTVIRGFRKDDNDTNEKTINTPQLKVVGCVHCGNQFERKAPKHIYCSDQCRITAWESRTGKKMKKSKVYA
jgi:hypothetical protein